MLRTFRSRLVRRVSSRGDRKPIYGWVRCSLDDMTLSVHYYHTEAEFVVRQHLVRAAVLRLSLPCWFVDTLSLGEFGVLTMAMLKKAAVLKKGKGVPFPAVDGELKKSYPTLHAHLCDLTYEDGEIRRTSSLIVFTEDCVWKGCLNDRDAGTNIWGEAPSFTTLLELLERRAGDPTTVWKLPTKKK